MGDLEPWDRKRLDQLFQTVLQLLEQPDVTGLDARNLVERRRAEAIRSAGESPKVVDRITHAPRGYLLSQEPARHRAPGRLRGAGAGAGRGQRRGAARRADDGILRWRIEVAAARPPRPARHGRPASWPTAGLDILDAAVATWGDGAALDTFLVQRDAASGDGLTADEVAALPAPDPVRLEAAIVAAFDQPLEAPPAPDAEVRFDDHASPWYTICEVRSPDRRGLLHHVTTAMAAAGASVHSARLVTIDGIAVDRFELTDRNERKLDDAVKDAVLDGVRNGVTAKRRRLSFRH